MPLNCTIDATGIYAPEYQTILDDLTARFRAIYGPDAYLEPDSQDGALLAIFALALHDTNSMAIAAYNAFSPATAQGEGLSRVVKINGIARKVPSFSTVDLLVTGQVGTVISNAVVTDASGGRWTIFASVVIRDSGEATATATYQEPGAFAAQPGTLTTIATPIRGWQTVTNPAAAAMGASVESDAGLRVRQAFSTALPSRSILDGMVGAVSALPNVARLVAYENDTDVTDALGIPAHTVSFVVDGGDAQVIANTISAKKAPGVGTFGTTQLSVIDVYSIPQSVDFFRPTLVAIQVAVTIQAQFGYTTPTGAAIQDAIAAYITALPIAGAVRLSRLYVPIDAVGSTFNVTSLTVARLGGALAAADIVLLFNEAAMCTAANVALTVIA